MNFKLDKTQCKLPPTVTPGAKFKSVELIKTALIYVPPMSDNPLRKNGKDLENVEILTVSMGNGIDYSKPLPVVRKNRRVIDGDTYDYELIDGNHRMEALFHCGFDEWLFDVYEFGLNKVPYLDSLRTFQLVRNDHPPQLQSTIDDVSNVIIGMIINKSSMIKNDEKSIGAFVDTYCKNMHYQTRGKIVRKVVAACGAYQDIVSFTPTDAERWVNKNGYKARGDYDAAKKSHGWITKEGYEGETILNAIHKFAETGKTSYVICYTMPPTEKTPLDEKRKKMISKFAEHEDALLEVFEHYKKNKTWPWSIEGFIPADRLKKEDPNTVVVM